MLLSPTVSITDSARTRPSLVSAPRYPLPPHAATVFRALLPAVWHKSATEPRAARPPTGAMTLSSSFPTLLQSHPS